MSDFEMWKLSAPKHLLCVNSILSDADGKIVFDHCELKPDVGYSGKMCPATCKSFDMACECELYAAFKSSKHDT